jgi:hypothetical protein
MEQTRYVKLKMNKRGTLKDGDPENRYCISEDGRCTTVRPMCAEALAVRKKNQNSDCNSIYERDRDRDREPYPCRN